MTRKRMVTRTIKSTMATVTVVATADNGEKGLREIPVEVTGEFKTEKALRKAVEAKVTEAGFKFVDIEKTETDEQLYGMDEELFLEVATPIVKAEKDENAQED